MWAKHCTSHERYQATPFHSWVPVVEPHQLSPRCDRREACLLCLSALAACSPAAFLAGNSFGWWMLVNYMRLHSSQRSTLQRSENSWSLGKCLRCGSSNDKHDRFYGMGGRAGQTLPRENGIPRLRLVPPVAGTPWVATLLRFTRTALGTLGQLLKKVRELQSITAPHVLLAFSTNWSTLKTFSPLRLSEGFVLQLLRQSTWLDAALHIFAHELVSITRM